MLAGQKPSIITLMILNGLQTMLPLSCMLRQYSIGRSIHVPFGCGRFLPLVRGFLFFVRSGEGSADSLEESSCASEPTFASATPLSG